MEMENTPITNNKENINTETTQHTEALSEAELNERKRVEFEALLEIQKTKRENIKQEKQINNEQNKDPKEMMLNIQKNFKEKHDALSKEVEEGKEGVNVDKLFASFDELKASFVDTSYSLTPYDRRLYSEQLDKLEISIHQLKEKTQPRKKFAFSKKIEKKTDVVKEAAPVIPQQETEQKDSLSMIKGVENKTNEALTLTQSDLEHNFKLQNLENCQININGRMKTLYLKNLKDCTVNIGVLEGACFIDGLTNCSLQLVAHQVRIHNSKNTTFKLFATSKPIIEHCSEVRFGQYDYKYETYDQDLIDAKLQGKENLWNQIQDFNWHKQEKSPNFELF